MWRMSECGYFEFADRCWGALEALRLSLWQSGTHQHCSGTRHAHRSAPGTSTSGRQHCLHHLRIACQPQTHSAMTLHSLISGHTLLPFRAAPGSQRSSRTASGRRLRPSDSSSVAAAQAAKGLADSAAASNGGTIGTQCDGGGMAPGDSAAPVKEAQANVAEVGGFALWASAAPGCLVFVRAHALCCERRD